MSNVGNNEQQKREKKRKEIKIIKEDRKFYCLSFYYNLEKYLKFVNVLVLFYACLTFNDNEEISNYAEGGKITKQQNMKRR